MSWGCYANCPNLKISIYLPRKNIEEARELIQKLSDNFRRLNELQLDIIYEDITSLNLNQISDIINCAKIVNETFNETIYPQYQLLAILNILGVSFEISNDPINKKL